MAFWLTFYNQNFELIDYYANVKSVSVVTKDTIKVKFDNSITTYFWVGNLHWETNCEIKYE